MPLGNCPRHNCILGEDSGRLNTLRPNISCSTTVPQTGVEADNSKFTLSWHGFGNTTNFVCDVSAVIDSSTVS